MKDALGSLVESWFKFMFGGGLFDSMKDILTANPSNAKSIYNAAWNFVVTIYDTVIVPLALGIMIIWFLVAFIQKSTSEQMNFDQLFLLCVKLIAAFYLINHGLEIFAKLWGLGIALINEFSGVAISGAPASGSPVFDNAELTEIWKSLTGEKKLYDYPSAWKSLGCILQMFFPYLICWVLSGVASFIAYSRMLEMLLRVAAAPIALSDFMNDGLHGAGWRYLKTFLAICLQGFVLLLIAKIYSSIVGQILSGAGGFMEATLGYLVITFSAVALMFKSLSFCKELVGADR